MLSVKLNKNPINILKLVEELGYEPDYISVYIIYNHKNRDGNIESSDTFAGECKVENGKIVSLDGDTYSADLMDVYYYERIVNEEDGIGLRIWVYDF